MNCGKSINQKLSNKIIDLVREHHFAMVREIGAHEWLRYIQRLYVQIL
jgi:hypothetical protein